MDIFQFHNHLAASQFHNHKLMILEHYIHVNMKNPESSKSVLLETSESALVQPTSESEPERVQPRKSR